MIIIRSALLAAAFTLVGVTAASATTITSTASYGPAGAAQTTDWSQVFTVDGFDPTLGTLTGVKLQFDSNGTFNGTVKNTSGGAADFKITEDINLSGSSSNAAINSIIGALTQDLVVSQSYTALASGTTAAFGPFSPTATATTTSTNFSAFESGPISATFSTSTGTTVSGGGGNIANAISTKAGATLTVSYTYTPTVVVPPSVPEPASLVLVLGGLAGLVMMRRRSI